MERKTRPGELIFELNVSSRAQVMPGFLGPWIAPADTLNVGRSFADAGQATTEPPMPEGPVWRSTLPVNITQSNLGFNQAEASLQSIRTALEISQVYIEALLKRQSGGTSFSVKNNSPELPVSESLPYTEAIPVELPPVERARRAEAQRQRVLGIERETLGLLSYSIKLEKASGPSFGPGNEWDAVSFGPFDEISGKWEQVVQQFQDFMDNLGKVTGHFAWVETRVGEQLIARTLVNWTGDMDTTWQIQPTPNLVSQHERNLQLALASRMMLLQVFGTISANAVKLSTLLAIPGGAVLALPVAFHFINQIQNDLAKYQGHLDSAW